MVKTGKNEHSIDLQEVLLEYILNDLLITNLSYSISAFYLYQFHLAIVLPFMNLEELIGYHSSLFIYVEVHQYSLYAPIALLSVDYHLKLLRVVIYDD